MYRLASSLRRVLLSGDPVYDLLPVSSMDTTNPSTDPVEGESSAQVKDPGIRRSKRRKSSGSSPKIHGSYLLSQAVRDRWRLDYMYGVVHWSPFPIRWLGQSRVPSTTKPNRVPTSTSISTTCPAVIRLCLKRNGYMCFCELT